MIFAIADIHSNTKRFDHLVSRIEREIGRPLDERDTIVCLGDLIGVPTRKERKRIRRITIDQVFLSYLSRKPYSVACVMGNHDSERRLYRGSGRADFLYGGPVVRMRENIVYLRNGEIYNLPIDATKSGGRSISVLALGGAFGHLSRYVGIRPMAKQQAVRQYFPIIFAQEAIEVDCVLSHEMPTSRMPFLFRFLFGANPLSDALDAIEGNLIFQDWQCGHHHIDFDAGKIHMIYERYAILGEDSADSWNAENSDSDC